MEDEEEALRAVEELDGEALLLKKVKVTLLNYDDYQNFNKRPGKYHDIENPFSRSPLPAGSPATGGKKPGKDNLLKPKPVPVGNAPQEEKKVPFVKDDEADGWSQVSKTSSVSKTTFNLF